MIVTLQALDPIFVDFFLPQQALAQITVGQTVTVKVDTYPGRELRRQDHGDQSQGRYRQPQRPGARHAAESPTSKLLPGMYATVDIDDRRAAALRDAAADGDQPTIPTATRSIIVDDKAKGADGKPQLVARQTFVTTGATRGDQVAVLSGVKEGDDGRHRRPDQAAQRRAGGDQQHGAARRTTPTPAAGRPADGTAPMKFTDIFIRRPVLATRGQPADPGARPARRRRAAGAAVSAHRERRRHGHDRPITAPIPTSSPASSPRRWRTPIAQANGIDYMTSTSQQRRQHDHRQSAAQLRCRQGADRDQHQDQLGAEPAAAGIAAAGADGQGRPDHRRDVYRLLQRRCWRPTRSPTTWCAWCSPSCRRSRRADRRDPRRQELRAARLARSGEAGGLWPDRRRRERRRWPRTTTSPASASTKGQMVQVDLTASTNLHSLEEFRNLVLKQAGRRHRAAGGRRQCHARRRRLRIRGRLRRQEARSISASRWRRRPICST